MDKISSCFIEMFLLLEVVSSEISPGKITLTYGSDNFDFPTPFSVTYTKLKDSTWIPVNKAAKEEVSTKSRDLLLSAFDLG